jgi:hypothetical protein
MTAANLRRFLSVGAVAGFLASSAYIAAPAWGTGEPPATTPPSAAASTTDDAGSGLSEAALAEAVQRDLGLTPEQFTAVGELGTRAAAAAAELRDVPGFVGIRLDSGQIVVSGSGDELLQKVATLASRFPELAVEAPTAPTPEKKTADAAQVPGPGSGAELAVSTEQLFQAYVHQVGPEGLQAVVAAGGKFVIKTGRINAPEAMADESAADAGAVSSPAASLGKVSPAEFVARYANVELDGGAHLAPEAEVLGGEGYIADTGWVCSTGFSAFDPGGDPALLSAGHCASDGAAQATTREFQFNMLGPLGEFGFSQFGGPGNSRIIEDPLDPNNVGNVGTDISVIETLSPELEPLAAAKTWDDPSEPGPDVKIVGSADPVVGMPVCRSGRTSFWSCGTVDAVGIFVVPGPGYAADPSDLRAFNGFLSYAVQSSGGDSGGPYVSGNYAVGTHAAGDTPDANGNVIQNMAIAATLRDSLAVLPGYELELFLNKPTVTSPAPGGTYEPGQLISGNVAAAPASAIAAGSSVRITLNGGEPFEVPLDGAGNWSFTAPESASGALTFTAETVNGFSESGTSSFTFEPAPTEPPAPGPGPVEPPAPDPVDPPVTGPELVAPADAGPAPADPAPANPAPSGPAGPADGGAAVVPPTAGAAPVANPPADLANTGGSRSPRTTALAKTGASALLPAAGAAAAAIAVGGVLMVLVRRRRRSG